MSKVKRSNHTVLIRVTSHGSGGRGKIIVGHPALESGFSDPHITNVRFKRFDVESLVVARITLSGKRRLTQHVREDKEVSSIDDFLDIYRKIRSQEAREYDKLHGTAYAASKSSDWIDADEMAASTSVKGIDGENEMTNALWDLEDIGERGKFNGSGIYIPEDDLELFTAVRNLAQFQHTSVLMVGASGYGKTSVPQQLAKDWDMNFLRQDCANVRDPEEFFGLRAADNGSTVDEDGNALFIKSEFTKAVERGNCIVVLDEINRADPYITNALFPLLDHAGKTNVAGHEIKVGENVIFFGTVNVGYEFTGTFTLDAALENRFGIKVLVEALPKEIETMILQKRTGIDETYASKIVNFLAKLREANQNGEIAIDASTRTSLQLAKLVRAGLKLRLAVKYVIKNGLSDAESKTIADSLGMV